MDHQSHCIHNQIHLWHHTDPWSYPSSTWWLSDSATLHVLSNQRDMSQTHLGNTRQCIYSDLTELTNLETVQDYQWRIVSEHWTDVCCTTGLVSIVYNFFLLFITILFYKSMIPICNVHSSKNGTMLLVVYYISQGTCYLWRHMV
jgi:hypothetical protein